MKIKVLVTGANGFLGTHLLQFLQKKNAEVHTLGTKPTAIGTYHSIAFNDYSGLEALVKEVKPTAIFHLAGISISPDIRCFYNINVVFAANLIEALKKNGNNQCRVILTGTSAEYGLINENDLPLTESTLARPYDHYGISKLAQTLMGQREARNGWPFIMIRPFNVVGPGMPSHLVLQSIVAQLKNIKLQQSAPILEVGDLSAQRDFVDVSDTVEAMWHLIHQPRAYGEIINICTGVAVPINILLDKLLAITNIQAKVMIHPNRLKPIDIPVHFGSNVKLRNLTGYSPQTDVDASLQQILAFEGLLI